MVKARIYRGIEYIRIGELPDDQKLAIKNWLNDEVIIKILVETTVIRDCILFKDYQHWFDNIYTQAVATSTQTNKARVKTNPKSVGGLAFD